MAKRQSRADRAKREREIAARARTAAAGDAGSEKPSAAKREAAKPDATPKGSDAERRPASVSWRSRLSGVGSELAERSAWSMLAALVALVGAGLALALASALTPALCGGDDASCALGWMVLIGMAGYVLVLLPACAIGGLGIWFWVAYVAGYLPLVMVAAVGDWWWWAALVLLPPVAAMVSAPLGRERLPGVHRGVLLALALAGLGAAVWWFGFAR